MSGYNEQPAPNWYVNIAGGVSEPEDSKAAPEGGSESGGHGSAEAAPQIATRLAPILAQETRSYATSASESVQAVAPSWWKPGVRVVDDSGRAGVVGTAGTANGGGWIVALDGGQSWVANANPALWRLEVLRKLTGPQISRITYDAERAMLRAFGCHYVPSFEELPESQRPGAQPKALNRGELDGLQLVIRHALASALLPYSEG